MQWEQELTLGELLQTLQEMSTAAEHFNVSEVDNVSRKVFVVVFFNNAWHTGCQIMSW